MNSFNVSLEVKTASEEEGDKLDDNFVNVTIPVEIRSLVRLHSISIPGQVETPHKIQLDNTSELHLTHLYTLHNLGPSPFPHGQLTIRLPHTPLVWLNNVRAQSRKSADNVALDCEVTSDVDTLSKHRKEIRTEEKQDDHASQPSASTNSDLACTSGQCTLVRCYVGLLHKDQSLLISLNITVRQNIMHKMKIARQLRIISSATFQEPDLPSFVSMSVDKHANATTFLVFKMHQRPAFAWWVLGVSIVSGFLLLYILIILLWKCGFFRRKSREELQKLIETSSHPEEFESLQPPSPSSAPPPFPSMADDDDVMVLPPTNSFFPDPAQQTLLLRNNNNISSDNFNHVHHRSGSLGYSSHQHQRSGSGGGGGFGGSLGRNRGHQQHQQHHHHWTPPPPPPLPAFNNQLYLEPLEHTV